MFKIVAFVGVFIGIVWAAPQPTVTLEYIVYEHDDVIPTPETDFKFGDVANPMLDGRIVGGTTTTISIHPYIVSVLRSGSHTCGGAIISATWILSAAHCFSGDVSSYSIRAGSSTRNSGGEVISVSRLFIHSNYDSTTIDYDIAAIELISALTIENARPISLAAGGTGPGAGIIGTISGWGALFEGGIPATELQVVNVPVVSQAQCRETYGQASITDRMFCAGREAGGIDACQGDSGGPLIASGVLTGLVSWGIGCARPNYPGVYTNIPALRSWISSTTGI